MRRVLNLVWHLAEPMVPKRVDWMVCTSAASMAQELAALLAEPKAESMADSWVATMVARLGNLVAESWALRWAGWKAQTLAVNWALKSVQNWVEHSVEPKGGQ